MLPKPKAEIPEMRPHQQRRRLPFPGIVNRFLSHDAKHCSVCKQSYSFSKETIIEKPIHSKGSSLCDCENLQWQCFLLNCCRFGIGVALAAITKGMNKGSEELLVLDCVAGHSDALVMFQGIGGAGDSEMKRV
jgi:hypothetical protein